MERGLGFRFESRINDINPNHPYFEIYDNSSGNTPIYGFHSMESRVFIVLNNELSEIYKDRGLFHIMRACFTESLSVIRRFGQFELNLVYEIEDGFDYNKPGEIARLFLPNSEINQIDEPYFQNCQFNFSNFENKSFIVSRFEVSRY